MELGRSPEPWLEAAPAIWKAEGISGVCAVSLPLLLSYYLPMRCLELPQWLGDESGFN